MMYWTDMNFRFLSIVLVVTSLAGCAGPSNSREIVVVNLPSPAVASANVKVYLQPPKKYTAITTITSSSKGSSAITDQDRRNVVLERIREMAGMLGANGILIRDIDGVSGNGGGGASGNGNGSAGATAGINPKVGSATAIIVEQE